MMDNKENTTKFVDAIMKRASELSTRDGRGSIDADYVLLAALDLVVGLLESDEKLTSEQRVTEYMLRIYLAGDTTLSRTLAEFGMEKSKKPRYFEAALKLNNIVKAMKEMRLVTAVEFIGAILQSPTDIIEKYFDIATDEGINRLVMERLDHENNQKDESVDDVEKIIEDFEKQLEEEVKDELAYDPDDPHDFYPGGKDEADLEDEYYRSTIYKKEDKPEDKPEEKPEDKPEDKDARVAKAAEDFLAEITEESKRLRAEEKKERLEVFNEVTKIKGVQKSLLETVFGQDHAVNAFVSGYFQATMAELAGKTKDKPKATFLFAGPPGVGKTFLAERIAAELKIPFKRFDMSEFSSQNSVPEFNGYMNYAKSKAGGVTGFVDENPECVILFDEIEKSHISIIHLFLQILDAGRLRDEYLEKEISFSKATLIFTTNVGRKLYENTEIENLSTLSRKQILDSLSQDVNPTNGEKLFPDAICSRFAGGNVVMFNRLAASNLLKIAEKELSVYSDAFTGKTGVEVEISDKTVFSMMMAEGGRVDARNIRGRAARFICQELYELIRLMTSPERSYDIERLKSVSFSVEQPNRPDVASLFAEQEKCKIVAFTTPQNGIKLSKLASSVEVICTDDFGTARELLLGGEVTAALVDVCCGGDCCKTVLNLEDADSDGVKFFRFATENMKTPTFIMENNPHDVSFEEELSFLKAGALDVVCLQNDDFTGEVARQCLSVYQQSKLMEISSVNKVLTYKTKQEISEDGLKASITLFDLRLETAPDADDANSLIGEAAKPTVRFDDVIGALDAKSELEYFVKYMRNPAEFLKKGVRAPKGVLLYGPPGTGKTLLAKAMAGESDVTFMAAEGNQFLKRYVGEGPEAVHELFRKARKYAPTILFIDEIDAIGKTRDGEGEVNSADTLTALLTEMDGFKSQTAKPVFVLAATNFEIEPTPGKKSLDSALVRRFDRTVYIGLPEKADRERYIRMMLRKHPSVVLSEEEITSIATRSVAMSLADLELVFELALRNAVKSDVGTVGDDRFEEAFETYNGGAEKSWDEGSLERTARHEAGHALLCWLSGDTPSYLTIVARGSHGGYMQHGDKVGKPTQTRRDLLQRIRTSLAGRAAEMVYYGDEEGVDSGASGDLSTATAIAERMVCYYGMDDSVGLSCLDINKMDHEAYSAVRAKVNAILSAELENAKATVRDNRDAMDALVTALLEKNRLKGDEIDAILSAKATRKN